MSNRQKETLKAALLYLIIFAAMFYAVPIPTKFYADHGFLESMLLMLNPLVCFLFNIFFCLRRGRGFVWYFPLMSAGLFGPSIPIFYNYTALPYLFAYIVIAYIGAATGYSIYKSQGKKNK